MLIMDIDPKNALNQAIVKETLTSQSELSPLAVNFYTMMNEYINTSAEKTSLKGKLETLKNKRKAKLIMIAGGTIPSNQIEALLTSEEIELFRNIRSASKTFDNNVLISQQPVLEKLTNNQSLDTVLQ